MKNWRTFTAAAAGAACLCLALQFVQAGDEGKPKGKPATGSTAVMAGCDVTGTVERREDGVYAVITMANPSAQEAKVEFNYAATCLPGRSMMSRVMIPATTEKQGACSYVVKAGETKTESILLKKSEAPKNALAADLWTLKIARGGINIKAGWGALNPAALGKRVELDKGQLVLATWQDKAAPKEA